VSEKIAAPRHGGENCCGCYGIEVRRVDHYIPKMAVQLLRFGGMGN
jgi:hypothetical protein